MILTPDDIHLWFAYPDEIRDPALLAAYAQLLTPEEKERWQRFHFERHRHQFLVTRALVRTTLSRYTDIPPHHWRFTVNAYGRPEIDETQNSPQLRFNLSHCTNVIVCALTVAHDIGVDVESTERQNDTVKLADRFFTPQESRNLQTLPPQSRHKRFFEYWTLKEAYIKARGMGLSIPLDRFGVEFQSHDRLHIRFDPGLEGNPRFWRFRLLEPRAGTKAAIAIKAGPIRNPKLTSHRVVPLSSYHDWPCPQLASSW